jgi:hypothetical protein
LSARCSPLCEGFFRQPPPSPSVSQGCGGRNRTCDVTLNRRPPVPTRAPPQSKSGRRDLNPRSRAPEARGMPDFPTSCNKSAQRELNPHFRPGKAAGCRYIMGANVVCRIVKEPSLSHQEHREGLEPSSPDHRCAAVPANAVSSPLDHQCLLFQWDQRDLNPHLAD